MKAIFQAGRGRQVPSPPEKRFLISLGLGVAVGLFSPGVLGAAPPNDDFAAATIVVGFPATATGSNVDATVEEGEPLPGYWYDYSVWYRWTAPMSGAVRIDTLEGGRDTILAVWTNAALTNLALVAQNDGYDETEMSVVFFDAVSGTTYQIAVYGYDYDLGDIALRITNDALPRISGTLTGPGGGAAAGGDRSPGVPMERRMELLESGERGHERCGGAV